MIIKCSACNKALVEIINRGYEFDKRCVVKCPYCFDQSFQIEIESHYSLRPLEGVELLDIDDKHEDNCLVVVYLADTES